MEMLPRIFSVMEVHVPGRGVRQRQIDFPQASRDGHKLPGCSSESNVKPTTTIALVVAAIRCCSFASADLLGKTTRKGTGGSRSHGVTADDSSGTIYLTIVERWSTPTTHDVGSPTPPNMRGGHGWTYGSMRQGRSACGHSLTISLGLDHQFNALMHVITHRT